MKIILTIFSFLTAFAAFGNCAFGESPAPTTEISAELSSHLSAGISPSWFPTRRTPPLIWPSQGCCSGLPWQPAKCWTWIKTGGRIGSMLPPTCETSESPGREHHNWAFTSWLAGAGVKRGYVHGATDEHGIRATEKPVHVHDFHATILHLMGIDYERLTCRQGGCDYRLTDIAGHVAKDVLS